MGLMKMHCATALTTAMLATTGAAPAAAAPPSMNAVLDRLAFQAPKHLGPNGLACVTGVTDDNGDFRRVQIKVTSREADRRARRLIRSVTSSPDVTTVRVARKWSLASMTRVQRRVEQLMQPYHAVSAIQPPPKHNVGYRRCGAVKVIVLPEQPNADSAAALAQRRYGGDRVQVEQSPVLEKPS